MTSFFSFLFQVGSLGIVCCLLKGWSALYIFTGSLLVFLIAFKTFKYGDDTMLAIERYTQIGGSLFYGLANITVVSKCPLGNRKDNFSTMMYVSLFWMCYHTLSLIILTICYYMDVLPVEVATTRLSDPVLFYSVTTATLLMGPLSILSLKLLKNIAKNEVLFM